MSRTRFHTDQLEPEVRGSPLPWSDESDGGSDRDQDETDEVERTPPRDAETEEYEAEGYCLRGGRIINRYREVSKSPVLSRRPIKQHAAVTKEYKSRRRSSETYHSEDYESKLQTDRQLQPESAYRPQFYEQEKKIQKSLVQEEDSIFSKKLLIFLVVLVTAFLIWIYLIVSITEESNHTSKDDMIVAVETALSRFENVPEDVVFQLSAGIRSIVESDPTKPSIFVLLHNNTGVGPFCLANAIGNVAMKYLESDEEYPLILKPDELLDKSISEDYGWVIENYKLRIEKHRSVIIADLQKIPGKVAMAFHFLCDIYSPVVPKSLFIFTFGVPNVYSKKEVEQAEEAMHRIWRNDVKDDQRQALITRLTEDVISLPQNILDNGACP